MRMRGAAAMRLAALIAAALAFAAPASPLLAQQTPSAMKTPAAGQAAKPDQSDAGDEGEPEEAAPEEPADAAGANTSIPFEGGTFTITETEDLEKVLAYEGKELARNYVAFFDRIVTVGGVEVALFSVGDGGNQCGPATVLAWKQDGEMRTQMVGEECGAPPAAATGYDLYFVPYVMPGATEQVQVWSPAEGLRTAGAMSFVPQPDTDWNDLDASGLNSMIAAFDNRAVYQQARKILGADFQDFVTGLMTGGEVETTASGVYFSYGCVPHACGTADSFMAIDQAGRKLYFAQQSDDLRPKSWPPVKQWPADVRAAMQTAIGKSR